ncbi:MAG: hypothetical protein JSS22_22950 [Proteobacteria bacterium]|nr:hypothetical protein [Pseudomonadota bacterium]
MPGPGRIAEFTKVPTSAKVARLFNFDIAQDRLKPEHKTWLIQFAIPLLRNGGSMSIIGLASTTGTDSFNSNLSKQRADSVIAFLRTNLPKGFAVQFELALGEEAARIAGLRDNVEDEKWRAIIVSVWDKPVPPPPPPPQPAPACKRLVIRASDGVGIYVFYNGPGDHKIIQQVTKVKASPGYIKNCATDFEKKATFLAGRRSNPIVYEYASDPGSNVVGEVVGHFFTINRFRIVASDADLKRLPSGISLNMLSIDAMLSGYTFGGPHGDTFISLGGKVRLFVSDDEMPGTTRIAYSSEAAESYDVATDVFGQIVAHTGTYASRYPKRESGLSVGEIVKDGAKKAIKDNLPKAVLEGLGPLVLLF